MSKSEKIAGDRPRESGLPYDESNFDATHVRQHRTGIRVLLDSWESIQQAIFLNALENGAGDTAGRAQGTGGLRQTGHLGIRLVIWCAHGSCNGDAEPA